MEREVETGEGTDRATKEQGSGGSEMEVHGRK